MTGVQTCALSDLVDLLKRHFVEKRSIGEMALQFGVTHAAISFRLERAMVKAEEALPKLKDSQR